MKGIETKTRVSMFGLTNSKELMLRCIQAGIPVSEAFFQAHAWDKMSDCATHLEDAYAGFHLKVMGDRVVARDNGWFWLQPNLATKMQSTIQPQSFVTLPPGNEALVNDLIASGLYRFWSEA
jgi:hypothetical protein